MQQHQQQREGGQQHHRQNGSATESNGSASSSCSHGGIYSASDHRLVRVDCSSSVNPLGTPPAAIDAIRKSAKALAPVYPDPDCGELKESLSQYLGVGGNQICVGNGALELVYWFARSFVRERVVIPAPTFCEYELASARAGAQVTFVPLRPEGGIGEGAAAVVGMELDADDIVEKARGADAVFLCNPNNPTGVLSPAKEILRIIEGVDPARTKVLLDECFVELADRPQESLVGRLGEFGNLVILRSLTKSFGLAGLRVGYSVSSPALAHELAARNRIPWNVNGLAQAAGVAALKNARSHLSRARAIIRKERSFLCERMGRLASFGARRSDANYFLVDLQPPQGGAKRKKWTSSTQFRDVLLSKTGVLVRDCRTFTGMEGKDCIRVAVKTRGQNLRLLRALEWFDTNGSSGR